VTGPASAFGGGGLVGLLREPAGEPEGALILNHGRGSDEHDLYGLLDDIPTVEGWAPELAGGEELPVLIHHGRQDPVISADFALQARQQLEAGGLDVCYLETDAGHSLPASAVAAARQLIAELKSPVPAPPGD
jgi:predicted esterase